MALRFFLINSFLFQIMFAQVASDGISLYYWDDKIPNFGDYISLKLVERIVGLSIRVCPKASLNKEKKLLAIGSIMTFARNGDVIWGSGFNGKWLGIEHYKFKHLDVRAVRGPLSRDFLKKNFNINCPEIYGDPALLVPYFFPEFQVNKQPQYDYIIIPHYSEIQLFPRHIYPQAVYPTESWDQVVTKILNSKFVISSSLHGIVIAEAFGIPARLLRITENEPLFKYIDYYSGTGRSDFQFAHSLEEAMLMGGEAPFKCDLQKLYESFPFEFWPAATFCNPFLLLGESTS